MTFDTDAGDDLQADINVTPLVDVMLVLLVIFMVVTPLLHRHEQVPVELPIARASEEPRTHDHVTLTAAADQTLRIDGERVARSALQDTLTRLYAGGRERTIFLAADRSLPYDFVVSLMDACRAAGVDRIGIVTRHVHDEAQTDHRTGARAGRRSAAPAG